MKQKLAQRFDTNEHQTPADCRDSSVLVQNEFHVLHFEFLLQISNMKATDKFYLKVQCKDCFVDILSRKTFIL